MSIVNSEVWFIEIRFLLNTGVGYRMFVLLPSVNMFKITMIWRWQIYSPMPLCTIVITGETCARICHMAERLDPEADSIDRLVCRSTKSLIQGSIWCVIGARVSGVESTGNREKGELIQRNKLYVVGCGTAKGRELEPWGGWEDLTCRCFQRRENHRSCLTLACPNKACV